MAEIEWCAEDEFEGIDLGDPRRNRRVKQIVRAISAAPDKPFPESFGSRSEEEAFYRFTENPYFGMEALLDGHRRRTLERCRGLPQVLILHDTTEFSFQGKTHRAGLGRLRHGGQGFFAHFSLASSADGQRRPLGVLNVLPWTRAYAHEDRSALWPFQDKEQERWSMAVKSVHKLFEEQPSKLIHVMDREGDDYSIFSDIDSLEGDDFIIRMSDDRNLSWPKEMQGQASKVQEALRTCQAMWHREVFLSRRVEGRTISQKKHYPAREQRQALLSMSATSVCIARPGSAPKSCPNSLQINVVRVWEENPPQDSAAVQWWLLTSLPVDTSGDTVFVVDGYRARWPIEEFNKSIKTGCQFEKRRGESLWVLLKVLALLIPVAWQLLMMRHLARNEPSTPAEELFNDVQLQLLSANGHLRARNPTIRQVMLAIAALGGHHARKREPGWMILGRGLQTLLTLEEGFRIAMHSIEPSHEDTGEEPCDAS